jgi:hypothetical protein
MKIARLLHVFRDKNTKAETKLPHREKADKAHGYVQDRKFERDANVAVELGLETADNDGIGDSFGNAAVDEVRGIDCQNLVEKLPPNCAKFAEFDNLLFETLAKRTYHLLCTRHSARFQPDTCRSLTNMPTHLT